MPAAADMAAKVLSIHSFANFCGMLVTKVTRQPVAEFTIVLPVKRRVVGLAGQRSRRAQTFFCRALQALRCFDACVAHARRHFAGALMPRFEITHASPPKTGNE